MTGKLMRDSATGKLMRYNPIGNDCGNCNAGEVPANIQVTFSGLSDCPFDCIYLGGGAEDYWWGNGGQESSLHAGTWVLPQTGDPCVWEQTFSISWVWVYRGPSGCGEILGTYYFEELKIRVTKSADSVAILAYLYGAEDNPWDDGLFFSKAGVTPSSDCVNATCVNALTNCVLVGWNGLHSGTAVITEIT